MPLILTALGLFVAFFAIKLSAKFVGVYFLAKRYIPHGSAYTTLLMSTGLTFGTIASVFGLTAGYINQVQVFGAGGRRRGNGRNPHLHRSKVVHAGSF